jgi:hypothetical protein
MRPAEEAMERFFETGIIDRFSKQP